VCTLHLFFQVFPEAPILFAVNRDELLDRPWDPPGMLADKPRIFGPRDVIAGGTWVGVNSTGVLAGLANHEGTLSRSQSPSLCSRGAVVLDTLSHASAVAGAAFAEATAPNCKSYTLLVADPSEAFVVEQMRGRTAVHRLAPGCHVVTNAPFRDPRDPKASRVLRRMNHIAATGRAPNVEEVSGLLADHGGDDVRAKPVCVHPTNPPRFGTSSATAIRVGPDGGVQAFLFAPGPPCTTPFVDLSPAAILAGLIKSDLP
jgi:uncharacterized protein with NRDE domain